MTGDVRQQRGREIALRSQIKREGNCWLVPSQSRRGKYKVHLQPENCTCPDYETRRQKCKHIYAVEFYLQFQEQGGPQQPALEDTETVKVKKPTYKQEWKAYHLAQTREKEQFQILLAELCRGVGEPGQVAGRYRVPLSDILFAAVFKVYSTVSCRRFMTDLREAQAKGYLSQTPHYNSIFHYLAMELVTPHLKLLIEESSLPLAALETEFAVDSSGFSTSRYAQWLQVKYAEPQLIDQKDWLKVHLMCGVQTNIVTAVEISGRYANDSPFFKPLVEATASNFALSEVSADKAYLSADNLKAVVGHGAMPYIPFKSNSVCDEQRHSALWQKMYHFYAYHQESFRQRYHKRSNAESTFAMIKAKFGDHLRSKSAQAQINEALCKILCHNICVLIQSMYELGLKPSFWSKKL